MRGLDAYIQNSRYSTEWRQYTCEVCGETTALLIETEYGHSWSDEDAVCCGKPMGDEYIVLTAEDF